MNKWAILDEKKEPFLIFTDEKLAKEMIKQDPSLKAERYMDELAEGL